MSLTQAIDEAVDFVHAHSDQMTRAEMDEFQQLAERVYVLAFRAKLTDALPKVQDLAPQLESADPLRLPPVQFESKLHLPGDWDTVIPPDGERRFLVCASPRWLQDMDVLKSLAEAAGVQEAESVEEPAELQLLRLTVDLACSTATLDGETHDVSSELALRWVKVLAERPGEWISAKRLEKYDPELMGVRTHTLRKYLPDEVDKLIEAKRGKGSRIRL